MNSKQKIINALFWKLFERAGVQIVSFIVSIILARMLLPSDYGTIALILVLVNLGNILVQGGFNTALIQKKTSDDLDFSSVFYLNFVFSIILYCILFFLAPVIAKFYNNEELRVLIRVLTIVVIIGSLNSIQVAYISKKMNFKSLFFSSISATIISSIVGISMAYNNFGVWSIIGQQITLQLFTTIIMWFTVKWRPKLIFSFKRLKSLFNFGSKVLLVNLSTSIFLNIRSLLIGKFYEPSMLGYYNKGKQFPELIIMNINGAVQSVLLSAYSNAQDDLSKIKSMVKKSMNVSSFIIFPMMLGLVVIAEPLIQLLLTEKWLMAVPYLRIYAITYMVMPIHTANLQAIKALGYSNIILKLDILRKIIEVGILIYSFKHGVIVIAIGELASTMISLCINTYPNKKILKYGISEQLRDMLPPFINSIIMSICIYTIGRFIYSNVYLLIIQILLGIVIYILLSFLFNKRQFYYIIETSREQITVFYRFKS